MELEKVGKQIKACRENAHLTQDALASLLGCTTQHISALERGIKQPSLKTLIQIAAVLEVSTDLLLQDILEPTTSSLANEIAAILSRLSTQEQIRCLHAIKAYAMYEKAQEK